MQFSFPKLSNLFNAPIHRAPTNDRSTGQSSPRAHLDVHDIPVPHDLKQISKKYLNWHFDFNDRVLRQEFLIFHYRHTSRFFLVAFTVFCTFIFLPFFVWYSIAIAVHVSSSKSLSTIDPSLIMMTFFLIISILCEWGLLLAANNSHDKGGGMEIVTFLLHPLKRLHAMTSSVTPLISSGSEKDLRPGGNLLAVNPQTTTTCTANNRSNRPSNYSSERRMSKGHNQNSNSFLGWIMTKFESVSSCCLASLCTLSVQCFMLLGFPFLLQQYENIPIFTTFTSILSIVIFMIPMILFAALPEIPIGFQYTTLIFSWFVVVGVEVYQNTFSAIPVATIMCVLELFWAVDIYFRNLQLFLCDKVLQGKTSSRSRDNSNNNSRSFRSVFSSRNGGVGPTGADLQAIEMRNMIGNVAHDLKTPLASFITGIDYIQFVINDCQRNLLMESSPGNNFYQSQTQSVNLLKEYVSSIQSCLNGIRNTNSFMLMTINRCIDYAKASRGFKLVPKFETIDLHETLQLPLDCMRNLQDRIRIEMKPISYEMSSNRNGANRERSPMRQVCSFIVTDKQWLQENILCLLSNAVKYSSKGSITIEVRRLSHDEDRALIHELAGITSGDEVTDEVLYIDRHAPLIDQVNSSSQPMPGPRTSIEYKSDDDSDDDDQDRIPLRQLSLKSSTFFLQQHESLRVTTRVMPLSCFSQDSDYSFASTKTNDMKETGKVQKFGNKEKDVAQRDTAMDPEMDANYYLAIHEKEKLAITQEQPILLPLDDVDSEEGLLISEELPGSKLSCKSNAQIQGCGVADLHALSAKNMPPTNAICKTSHPSPRMLQQDFLLFEIEDTGIGMTDDAMRNLFNPFQQTQRYAGGTGLGLFSLAKRIEALHGHYGVKRRRDGEQGSLFWFTIPYKPDLISAEIVKTTQEDALPVDTPINANNKIYMEDIDGSHGDCHDMKMLGYENRRHAVKASDHGNVDAAITMNSLHRHLTGSSFRVLIVDDSPTLSKMTRMMLSKSGYGVVTVDSGAAAIDLLSIIHNDDEQSHKFDLILMDMQMPVMDGFEATRRIRLMEKIAHTTFDNAPTMLEQEVYLSSDSIASPLKPSQKRMHCKNYVSKIVGMSAYSDNETLRMATECGMDLFIEKPFSTQTFNELVMKNLFPDVTSM